MHALMNLAADPDLQARWARQLGVEPLALPPLTRRLVLQGFAGAGLVLGFGVPGGGTRAAATVNEGSGTGPLAPNPFLRIGTDGIVTVVCKHHEMGQGNLTGLTSLVAEELDADWAQMRSEAAPSDATRYNNLEFGPMQGTGGSSAISNSYLQYRAAGATARAMLVAAAADAWKVPAAQVRVDKGVLSHASGKRATFGDMAEAASRQPVPEKPTLKEDKQFAIIGKDRSTPRVDSPAKCDGSAVYTIDVKLPGLLTAVIAFPPSFGAKLVSFDPAPAKAVKGVTDVVQVPEGVAVVATGTWAALQGRRALKLQWDESTSGQLDSEKTLALYRERPASPASRSRSPTTRRHPRP
jgi:isoquinoline 1-oxidoreductase beta subunit